MRAQSAGPDTPSGEGIRQRMAAVPPPPAAYCRYSLKGNWQSCFRRKFRNFL